MLLYYINLAITWFILGGLTVLAFWGIYELYIAFKYVLGK